MKFPAIAAVVFAAVTAAPAAEKPVHLFILSGQSNMAGMNPQAGFVPEGKERFPEAEVAFIKVAKGGQPIRHWVAEWDEIAAKHGIDPAKARAKDQEKGTPYYQAILDQAGTLMKRHPEAASVTLCWMQGENDARNGLDAAYGEALGQLVANLRRDLKRPDMNVVIGRICDFGKPDDAAWQAVRKAQVDVAGRDPRAAWVDCDDLNDKVRNGKPFNDLHYTPAGYQLLGQRYIRQAKALIEGAEPAEDGRP